MGIQGYVIILAWILVASACLLLAARERTSGGSLALGLSLLLSVLISSFDFLTLHNSLSLDNLKRVTFFCEAILPFAWLSYSLGLRNRTALTMSASATIYWGVGLLTLSSMVAFIRPSTMLFNPEFGNETILFLNAPGFYFYVLMGVYLVSALVVLERTFAGMSRQNRWKIKLEVVGIGSVISVQIVFYSQAMMYRTIDFALRSVLDAALVLGISFFLYSRIKRGHPQNIIVSDAVTYRSLIVLAASLYLVFMGLVGEGVKFFGPSSNRNFVLVLALCCGIALCLVGLSSDFRRKVQVFIHKHFYPHRYDYRAKWLEMTARLSSSVNEKSLCLAILEMYCHTFALKGGALFLRKSGQSHFFPNALHEWSDAPARIDDTGALVNFLQTKRWVFNRFENMAELSGSIDARVIDQYHIQFVVPLFFNDRAEGFILLGEQINTGEPVIYEDYDLMKALANQSSSALHNLHLRDQLVDVREMAAIGKVSTFVMHDLKNLMSNLALVVDNAKDHIEDREFQQDMVETLSNSVSRIKGLIDRLKNFEAAPCLVLETCDLKKLAEETLHHSAVADCKVNGESVALLVDRQEISRVILNLALNASEARGKGGSEVKITTGVNGRAFLTVEDYGCGMTEEYIDTKLFKPFETTKVAGFGIGLYQSRQIVEAHGGEMQVTSRPGVGTTFTVWLPSNC